MIYVVDDDEAVRSSVQALLMAHRFSTQCYAGVREFLNDVALDQPGCVITDVAMPDISGLELVSSLKATGSALAIVVVTGVADVPMAVRLMEYGALTLLQKPYVADDLLAAVRRGLTISHEHAELTRRQQDLQQKLALLTEEERGVMECMLADKPNKAIAAELSLSLRTVDRRRQTVLEKLAVESIPEMAILIGSAHLAGKSPVRS